MTQFTLPFNYEEEPTSSDVTALAGLPLYIELLHGLGFHRAVDEMADIGTFRGYGPEQGYEFLREAIATNDYQAHGADISADEIFVSDGSKCDSGNIQELFSDHATVAVPDPVYPVYVDTNVMAGRTGIFREGRYEGLNYMECHADQDYLPAFPSEPVEPGVSTTPMAVGWRRFGTNMQKG